MSAYVVTNTGRESSGPSSNYLFDVSRGGRKVAELSHDYRGDEYQMRLPGVGWISLPDRIIVGGGPKPLTNSKAGVQALDRLLG